MTGPPPETEAAVAPTTGTTADNTPESHRPVTNRTAFQNSAARCQVTQARKRRAAAWRCAPLLCGCTDPDTGHHDRHNQPPPTQRQLDGWADAARHILAQGLTPVVPIEAEQGLWRRSRTDRHLIQQIRGTT